MLVWISATLPAVVVSPVVPTCDVLCVETRIGVADAIPATRTSRAGVVQSRRWRMRMKVPLQVSKVSSLDSEKHATARAARRARAAREPT